MVNINDSSIKIKSASGMSVKEAKVDIQRDTNSYAYPFIAIGEHFVKLLKFYLSPFSKILGGKDIATGVAIFIVVVGAMAAIAVGMQFFSGVAASAPPMPLPTDAIVSSWNIGLGQNFVFGQGQVPLGGSATEFPYRCADCTPMKFILQGIPRPVAPSI